MFQVALDHATFTNDRTTRSAGHGRSGEESKTEQCRKSKEKTLHFSPRIYVGD
jgi:hypothetical protein